jgi:hypothetical protein
METKTNQQMNTNMQSEKPVQKSQFDWKIYLLLILVFIIIVISFLSPFILTRNSVNSDFDFSKTGQIGDTIGGLMNPFIALAGVIVTGLAFYIQYKANQQQREMFLNEQAENKRQFQEQIDNQNKQNQLQLFEAQFYEMLRLHKENVNEIELAAKRKLSTTINGEIENKYETFYVTKRNAFVELKKEFEFILRQFKSNGFGKINKASFKKCYDIFFWGLNKVTDDQVSLNQKLENATEETLENILFNIKNNQFPSSELGPYEEQINFEILAFEGHSEFFGHYYRHLFHTVKFVVFQDEAFLDYEQKIKYLRILRAQLSNHEQMLLFYNWLSGYGYDWENEKQSFFTKYCMIHNLWYDSLYEDDWIKQRVDFLRNKEVTNRKGKMFEMDK